MTIRAADTNLTRTTQTDSFGTFRLSDLLIRTYEVRAASDGFTAYTHAGVTLAIGQTARMSIVLHPAGIVEEVSVSAQPPPLDSRQTSVATVIDTQRIEELPVRSRNYLEFVLLAPGVTRASPPPTGGALTSVLPGSGFSFQGLRPRSNTLTIDGIDNTDEFSGSSRTELSLEVVREFQVVKSGWLAESGGGSAGSINVVTKSGANTLHGDVFAFGQSGIFNARPKLEETLGAEPALRRYRAGAAVGGPISRDRTFYYAAAEREGTHDETASDISPSTASAINRSLDAGLLPEIGTRQLTVGPFPTARSETETSVKMSHTLGGRGLLVGAIAANQNMEDHDAFNRGGLSISSSKGGFMLKRCTVIIMALASIISASAVAGAQTNERADPIELFPVASPAARPLFASDAFDALVAQQPAGPPPTPRHTGIKAMTKHLVTNFKYLPSMENLYWAGAGGGLALAVHPFDDNVNEYLVGNDTAEKIFKFGEVLGELGPLLGSASVVYAVGRIKDQPKVSHLGMDLIEALAMSEALTQTLKYTTRRERPDHSSKNSFPSGHAADTFAFATALERHLNWKYSIPAYVFSSYVALSRLPANRHWLSDAVFGSAVGIIAGRTVTSHEAERPYPVAVTIVPGGVEVMYARNK